MSVGALALLLSLGCGTNTGDIPDGASRDAIDLGDAGDVIDASIPKGPTLIPAGKVDLLGYPSNIIVGDLTGDGLPEVVLQAPELVYFANNGDLSLQVVAGVLPLGLQSWNGGAASDVDDDGLLDLVLAPLAHVLMQRADGTFADDTSARLPAFPCGATRVKVIDLTGDGAPDIFQTHRGLIVGANLCDLEDFDNVNRIYVNDGTGHFTDETAQRIPSGDVPNSGYWSQVVDVADFDGDGSPDLVIGNGWLSDSPAFFNGQPGELYLNDGTGHFSLGPTWTDSYTQFVHARDLDSNGTMDVVAGLRYDTLIEVDGSTGPAVGQRTITALNSGKGTLTQASTIVEGVVHFSDLWDPGSPVLFPSAALGDLDGDGTPDLLLGCEYLFFHNGAGQYLAEPGGFIQFPPGIERLLECALSDLDGDGDLDLVGTFWDEAAHLGQLVILENVSD